MRKISISHFGPIRNCRLETKDFMVLMGPQASGKSTIAKLIYFFNNIGGFVLDELRKTDLSTINSSKIKISKAGVKSKFKLFFKNTLIKSFRQMFPDLSPLEPKMKLTAYYEVGSITISVTQDEKSPDLDIQLTTMLWEKIKTLLEGYYSYEEELNKIQAKLQAAKERGRTLSSAIIDKSFLEVNRQFTVDKEMYKLFNGDRDVIYIPAGRSIITLLSAQWDYLYSIMDDRQKSLIDYCTRSFLERILMLKSAFKSSTSDMIRDLADEDLYDYNPLYIASDVIRTILQGEYQYIDGEEKLKIIKSKTIKINFASSGQQEALWILNTIFYNLVLNKRSLFIIEEPESNLFPSAQKLMTEFIALAQNSGDNQIIITTHSPYILGTLNNLLFAKQIEDEVDPASLDEIISKYKRIDFKSFSAYYMQKKKIEDCRDEENHSIRTEVIESASEDINGDYDRMLGLLDSY